MGNRTRLSLDLRELLLALDELVRLKPQKLVCNPTPETQEWVGRARALIGSWDDSQEPAFRKQTDILLTEGAFVDASAALTSIMNTIQEARNELRLITGGRVSGAFHAGQPFDFY